MVRKRDRIWKVASDLSERRGSFTAADVLENISVDPPTKRTVLDALNAMVDLGVLECEGGEGRAPRVYFPPAPTPTTDGGYTQSQPGNQAATFPYPGGKGRHSAWIIDKIPAHDCWVEVLGGSAAVTYNKQPSKNEIYNDVNNDLTQFFEVLRDRGDELAEWLKNLPYSRSTYEKWVGEFFEGTRPDDPIERAGRFFFLRYSQFAGDISKETGFKVRAKRSPARSWHNARERITELRDRFSEVTIENRDYTEIVEAYDDSDDDTNVVFYCDPPYRGSEHYYGEDFNHAEFVEALTNISNDWMVSYTDLPPGLDQYYIYERSRRHRMTRGQGEVTERLVTNFDIEERNRFVSEEITQLTLGE